MFTENSESNYFSACFFSNFLCFEKTEMKINVKSIKNCVNLQKKTYYF